MTGAFILIWSALVPKTLALSYFVIYLVVIRFDLSMGAAGASFSPTNNSTLLSVSSSSWLKFESGVSYEKFKRNHMSYVHHLLGFTLLASLCRRAHFQSRHCRHQNLHLPFWKVNYLITLTSCFFFEGFETLRRVFVQ